jgi:hypothetical protein
MSLARKMSKAQKKKYIRRAYLRIASLLDEIVTNRDFIREEEERSRRMREQSESFKKELEREKLDRKSRPTSDLDPVKALEGVGGTLALSRKGVNRWDKAAIEALNASIEKKNAKSVAVHFKSERFKHPLYEKDPAVTHPTISFYTLVGWLDSKDDIRRKYAESVYKQLLQAVSGSSAAKEALSDFLVEKGDNYYVRRLHLPKDVEPSDLEELSERLRDSILSETQHFGDGGFLSRTLESQGKYYKFLMKKTVQAAQKGIEFTSRSWSSEADTDPELADALNQAVEDLISSQISGQIVAQLGSDAGLLLANSLGVLGEATVGIATYGASSLVSLFVSALITGVKGQKPVNQTLDYESLVADVVKGLVTPAAIGKEFLDRTNTIMSSTRSLAQKYDDLVEVAKEYEERVKPQLERALFLLGKGDGSDMFTFLKRASEEKDSEDMRVAYVLRTTLNYIEQYQKIDNSLKDTDNLAKRMNEILKGQKPLNKEVVDEMVPKLLDKVHKQVLQQKKPRE